MAPSTVRGCIINAGLFLASANGAFSSVTFTNNGTFRNLGGTTYCYGSPFVNNGLVDVEGGALSFNSGGTLGGTYNVAGYCTLLFASGNFTASAPPVVSGLGTSQFTGGTLTLLADQISGLALIGGNVALGPAFQNAGAITNLTISGSYLLGSNVVTGTLNLAGGGPNAGWLAVAPNGLLNLNSTSQINLPGSVLVNNGTVAWSGGIIQGNSGTLITNNNLWLVQTDNAVNNGYGGTPTFVNNGTFTKTATYGATTFSAVSFLNSGTLDIESGSVNFANSGTYAQTGATLEFGAAAPESDGRTERPGRGQSGWDIDCSFPGRIHPVDRRPAGVDYLHFGVRGVCQFEPARPWGGADLGFGIRRFGQLARHGACAGPDQ